MRGRIPLKFILGVLGAAMRFVLGSLDRRKKKKEENDAVL